MFFCVRPAPGVEFDVQGSIWCEDDLSTPEPSDLQNYAFVHPCADADPDCVPPECGEGGGGEGGSGGAGGGAAGGSASGGGGDGGGGGSGSGECEARYDIVTLCGREDDFVGTPTELSKSMAKATGKIVDFASGYYGHPNVPGNINADPNDPTEPPPAPFCFVSCFNEQYALSPKSCPPPDDPGIRLTSTFVSLDPDSQATVTVNTTDQDGNVQAITSSVGIEGTVAIDVPRACRGLAIGEAATCDAQIGSVLLTGSSDLVVQGFTISGLTLTNRADWTASATAAAGTTTVALDAAPAFVTGRVEPFALSGMTPELSGFSGVLDWNARTYRSTAVFPSPLGNGDNTALTLSGTILNIPPRADAGPDQVFECTGDGRATVTLTAGGTDPDGDDDLAAFVWSRKIDGAWVVSSGPTLTAPFRLGQTNVALTAIDSARANDTDGARITVVDGLSPELLGLDVATDCLWPPNHKMHLFRLGEEIQPDVVDACDSSPTVRIVAVTSSQPDNGTGDGDTVNDIRFGDDAVCLRAERSGSSNQPRLYTVIVEAVDANGNATLHDLVIRVPKKGSQCQTGHLAPVVQDDDPRCQ